MAEIYDAKINPRAYELWLKLSVNIQCV